MVHLMLSSTGRTICYTDGACPNNGRSNAAGGYGVVFGLNHPWYVLRLAFLNMIFR